MRPQLNWRNLFQNPGHLNLPSPTLTTRLRGTPLPLGPALLTCPLAVSPRHCNHIQKALLLHLALLLALLLQPLTHLPSVQPHLRCPRGQNPWTREEKGSPHRTTQSLWSLVRKNFKNMMLCLKVSLLPLFQCMQWLRFRQH